MTEDRDVLKRIDQLWQECGRYDLLQPRPGSDADSTRESIARWSADFRANVFDLCSWFEWHNGQDGVFSVSPNVNWLLLSIDEASAKQESLTREWGPSYFPFMTNLGGAALLFSTESGAIFSFWETEVVPEVEYPSIGKLAEVVRADLEALRNDPIGIMTQDPSSWKTREIRLWLEETLDNSLQREVSEASMLSRSTVYRSVKNRGVEPLWRLDIQAVEPGATEVREMKKLIRLVRILDQSGVNAWVEWGRGGPNGQVRLALADALAVAQRFYPGLL